ncbi:ORF-118 [Teiidae poxvirus 1]|nr:ORF-118 [Teiidae poxvirus 1]
MFVLFLIVCYFILIFNIIIPKIAEKLRLEHEAFIRYRQIYGNKFRCINNTLINYSFTPFGVKANYLVNKDTKIISSCDEAGPVNILTCNDATNFPKQRDVCERAYLELFL